MSSATKKAQRDSSDEAGWLVDVLLERSQGGDKSIAGLCPKAIARAHARVIREREERDILREALRRMVLLVDIRLDAGDLTSDEYDDFAGASKLVGAVAPHREYYAERGLASIRAAVEARRSGT